MKAYIAVVQPFPPAGEGYFLTTIVFIDVVDQLNEMNHTFHVDGFDTKYPPEMALRVDTRPDQMGDLNDPGRVGGRYTDGMVLLEKQLPGSEMCVLAGRLVRLRLGALMRELKGRLENSKNALFDTVILGDRNRLRY